MSRSRSKSRIGIEHAGSLTNYGYHSYDLPDVRRCALFKAMNEYGTPTTFKKVNALAVFNKNNPALKKIYESDKKWIRSWNSKSSRSPMRKSPMRKSRSRSRSRSCNKCGGIKI